MAGVVKKKKQTRLARYIIKVRCIAFRMIPLFGKRQLDIFEYRLIHHNINELNGRDVVVASCDDAYFRRFAPSLLESANRLAAPHALHLHLIEPSEDTVEKTRELAERLGNIRLSYTIDPGMARHPDNAPRIAYTAARFVLAPLLLEAGARRLLIIDIDTLMRRSPWPILDRMQEASVGFVFRNGPRKWQTILANAVLFTADAPSRRFAEWYARALLANLLARQEYYVDQIVAHYLVELAGRKMRSRIKALPPSIMSMTYEEDAAFWTAKGDDKDSGTFKAAQKGERTPA